MTETLSGSAQGSQEPGIQSSPEAQGTAGAHTPGPWTVVLAQKWPYTVRVTAEDGAHEVMSQHGAAVSSSAKIYEDYLDGVGFKHGDDKFCSREKAREQVQQQIANARLIAAAPDLLARLSVCLCTFCGYMFGTPVERDCAACADDRAAIAKAEGR